MKILSVVSTYPPHSYGGGEVSAINLNRWLASVGHDTAVVTMAGRDDSEELGGQNGSVELWRVRTRRPYAYWENTGATRSQKLEYYFRDHLDPSNRVKMGFVLDQCKPDFVLIHVAAGLGWNALREVGLRDVPSVYFMHDLNLVCANGGMFKDGRDCMSKCLPCRAVSWLRGADVLSIPRLGFISPSLANLEHAKRHMASIATRPTAVILNANRYPAPEVEWKPSPGRLRAIYVGRLHKTKGVDVLIKALKTIHFDSRPHLTVVGAGAHEEELRSIAADDELVEFTGFQDQQTISNYMAASDLLCAPSVWPENSPGVVIHALSQGLPVLGSKVGGIPELVLDGVNGMLLPPGDIQAWGAALTGLATDRTVLQVWRSGAAERSKSHDQTTSGRQIWEFMKKVAGSA